MKEIYLATVESGDVTGRRDHSGRAICPRHATCPFTDCPHIKRHWRGTHCSRDRRDDCPTCTALSGDYVKKKERKKSDLIAESQESATLVEKTGKEVSGD